MLNIHFLNVGEGDSTLLEWTAGGVTKYALIDTGLEDIGQVEGDLRKCCVDQLRDKGITKLEFLAITHLHRDHSQALGDVLAQAKPKRFFTSYLPADTALRAPAEPETALPKVKKMAVDLNRYSEWVEQMHLSGTELTAVTESGVLYDDGTLRVAFLMPSKCCLRLQNTLFDMILAGQPVPEAVKAQISGMRNNNSLRLRISFAGRVFECDGDYYYEDAEREDLEPCDILKVAHHGDMKSMNPKLAEKLSPAYAVISWSARYKPEKDRPSMAVTKALRDVGAEVFFTGPRGEPGHPAEDRVEAVFTVDDDGTVIPPERAYRR